MSFKVLYCSLKHDFFLITALNSELKSKKVHVTLCRPPFSSVTYYLNGPYFFEMTQLYKWLILLYVLISAYNGYYLQLLHRLFGTDRLTHYKSLFGFSTSNSAIIWKYIYFIFINLNKDWQQRWLISRINIRIVCTVNETV